MLEKTGKVLGLLLAAGVVAGGGLYLFGVRIALDGGGGIHSRSPQSADERAELVARHREAQRAKSDPNAPPATARAPDPPTVPALVPEPTAAVPAPAGAVVSYWTDFRGPSRDGHYRERPVLTDWPSGGLQPLWKQPLGGGHASFVAARGRAFTIEQRGPQEVASAYDVLTGRELWTNQWTAAFRETYGGEGPRATPTWAEGRVYVLGGHGELRCLDEETGTLVWRTNILEDAGATNLEWGMSASPLVVDDTVVVLPGGTTGQSVVAYDTRTGKRAWAALNDRQAYSSPMLVTIGGVRQILVFSGSRVVGITPGTADVLWEHPWTTHNGINVSQPLVVGPDRIFISSGYGTGAAVIELTKNGDRFTAREVWRNIRMKNAFSSSVLLDGYVYGLDESILACVDAATGALKWKGGRYGYGEVMLASGHLIVVTEEGELVLVRATPERHVEVVRFPVLDGRTWNHPAIADGLLLVRNINEMAAFDLRLPPSRASRK